MLLQQLLQLQLLSLVLGGDPLVEVQPGHGHQDVLLNRIARETVDEKAPDAPPPPKPTPTSSPITSMNTTNTSSIHLEFADNKGVVLARLDMTSNFTVSLATTKCQGTVTSDKFCCSLSADPSKCKPGAKDRFANAGMVVLDKKIADVTLTGIVSTQGKNESITFNRAKGDARKNSTNQLTLTMTYTELRIDSKNYTPPASAILELVVTTEGENRVDYWNVTKATLKLEGNYNTTIAYPKTTDVTAQFGYTWAEPACTAPYAPCAPHGLAWTCNNQTFAPTAKTLNATYFDSINATAASADLPGFRLRLGPRTKERGEEFGWDCDPLIPISVWVSVLITLFLASILMWGVCMLAYLNTPTKFDDPKGPSIYVPSAE